MFELFEEYKTDNLSDSWNDWEFNIVKVENLSDKHSFADLYRGIILFQKSIK